MSQSEQKTIRKAASGDRLAFHDLVVEHSHAMFRLAWRLTSDVERSALLLKHFEGHSINEVARILEITTGACKQTIFRAVKKMRIALRPLVTT